MRKDILSSFNLEGRTAIVTGATGLLGLKHCEILKKAGARVVLADISLERCLREADLLGGDVLALEVDVTSYDSLIRARTKILSEFKTIDILVNNAAINDKFESPELALEFSRFENYPLQMWERMFRVNVTGMFLSCQVFGSVMSEQGRGSIINVASTYGVVGPDQSLYRDENGKQLFFKSPSYPATKGAVISFTRYLAAYWGRQGVRVNTLSPGGVENGQDEVFLNKYSERTPLGRMASPDDYQGALLFLASDASSYMTGANLIVDGGWTSW